MRCVLVTLFCLGACGQPTQNSNSNSEEPEPEPLPESTAGGSFRWVPECQYYRLDADEDGYADPETGDCVEGELPPGAIWSKDSKGEDCDPNDPTHYFLRCFDGDGDSRCPEEDQCVGDDVSGYIRTNVWHGEKDCDDEDPEIWDSVFEDLDGDGYGSEIYRCRSPDETELLGWSPRDGDCNDANPDIFPGNFRIEGEVDTGCGFLEVPEDWVPDEQPSCQGPALALVAPYPPLVCGLPSWVHPSRIVFRIENRGDETVSETVTLRNIGSVPGEARSQTLDMDIDLDPGETTPWIDRAVRVGITLVSETSACDDSSHSVLASQATCGH